jgi:phosphopantothenoylcysteine decarboxylase/phosphopantothenate--cysteine ligase
MSHIELARWADTVLIAPATAEIMARLAGGGAADLLTTLCLATEAPVVIAPAMNHVMWGNAAVQANRQTLEARGVHILGPAHGSQACGETGAGRMLEPDDIAAEVFALRGESAAGALAGTSVLVTAGPTREAIDPVRYLSNRSSGKMGYAIARAAAAEGATVRLVSGPVSLPQPAQVEVVAVTTAEQMHSAVHAAIGATDIFIAVAAVADYRPAAVAGEKIKKTQASMRVDLVRTRDILASVAALDEPPFTVGFAAETDNLREHALAKLAQKNLDMIVANPVGHERGFDADDNTLTVFWPAGEKAFETAPKTELAQLLVALIAENYDAARAKVSADAKTVVPIR